MTNSIPLHLFDLPTGAVNSLKRNGIFTLDDLKNLAETEGLEAVLKIRGIGEATYERLKDICDKHKDQDAETIAANLGFHLPLSEIAASTEAARQAYDQTDNNLCGTCGRFALEPFKRRAGACMGSYDQKTASYHATSYYRTAGDCWWCPGWLDPESLAAPLNGQDSQ